MCVCVRCAGPFWICVTLVFSVAISGNLSTFLSSLGDPSYHHRPQFHRGQSLTPWPPWCPPLSAHCDLSGCSYHSCGGDLPVCLAGADWSVGVLDLETGRRAAGRRLLLPGDGVRLWILALHLHPDISE